MSIGVIGRWVGLIGWLAIWLGAGSAWASDGTKGLGFFESRRVVKQANQALEAGRHDQALELYSQLIEGLDKSDDRRAEAYYRSALAAVAKSPADLDLARNHLAEVPKTFRGQSGSEVKALRALLAQVESVTAAKQEVQHALKQEKVTQAETADELAEATVAESDLQKLQKQNARLRHELEQTRAELARREEALAKLKAVVVGGGG